MFVQVRRFNVTYSDSSKAKLTNNKVIWQLNDNIFVNIILAPFVKKKKTTCLKKKQTNKNKTFSEVLSFFPESYSFNWDECQFDPGFPSKCT